MSGKMWAAQNLFGAGSGGDESRTLRLAAWIKGLTLEAVQQMGSLELVPLRIERPTGERDVLLHEALAAGVFEIRERKGGVVGEVEAVNKGGQPVLILEGETLVGCKQNRVVAASILVPPRATVVVTVGCMERGRWSERGGTFRAGGARMDPKLRRSTLLEMNVARLEHREARLDQSRLWQDVDCRLSETGVRSASADYHRTVEQLAPDAADSSRQFIPVRGQVGVVALWRGKLLGIEIAGHPDTWTSIAGRALPALVMASDAADAHEGARPPGEPRQTREWLGALAGASVTSRPSRGTGLDLTIRGDRIEGAALWHDGRPLHLIAFE